MGHIVGDLNHPARCVSLNYHVGIEPSYSETCHRMIPASGSEILSELLKAFDVDDLLDEILSRNYKKGNV